MVKENPALNANLVRTLAACLGIAALCETTPGAVAKDFAVPAGEVVLTASGQIAQHNNGPALQLDREQLAALPQHHFRTTTVWTEGKSEFSGVLLKDFIAAVGATGSTIALTASNDYQIIIPMNEVYDDGPLLALEQDGKPLTMRTKGPVWLIYPYDDNAEYRSEKTFARSIWQLDRIDFED